MKKLIFGYWDIHGLGLPVRELLEVAGADYEEKIYYETNRDEWFNEKYKLGLFFPNIPYLIDGENKITEHLAIIRYIARKYNLNASNEKEAIIIDQAESHIAQISDDLFMVCYDNTSFEKSYKEYFDSIDDKLEGLENLLSKNKYIVGDRLTYVDVYLHVYLVFLNIYDEKVLQKKPNLLKFLNNMNELPSIKNYKNSNRWKERRFCGLIAHYKGTY